MDSIPPATTMSAEPALIISAACITAFMPDPQSLLIVTAPVLSGMPAKRIAWRAGPCFKPAGSTQPIMTSSTSCACSPARETASLITAAPNSGAVFVASEPWKPPIAVRAPLRITMFTIVLISTISL